MSFKSASIMRSVMGESMERFFNHFMPEIDELEISSGLVEKALESLLPVVKPDACIVGYSKWGNGFYHSSLSREMETLSKLELVPFQEYVQEYGLRESPSLIKFSGELPNLSSIPLYNCDSHPTDSWDIQNEYFDSPRVVELCYSEKALQPCTCYKTQSSLQHQKCHTRETYDVSIPGKLRVDVAEDYIETVFQFSLMDEIKIPEDENTPSANYLPGNQLQPPDEIKKTCPYPTQYTFFPDKQQASRANTKKPVERAEKSFRNHTYFIIVFILCASASSHERDVSNKLSYLYSLAALISRRLYIKIPSKGFPWKRPLQNS